MPLYLILTVILFYSCSKDDSSQNEDEIVEVLNLPQVITYEASDITPVSAQLSFKVINQQQSGVVEAGIIIGFEPNLSLENNSNSAYLPLNELGEYSISLEPLPEESSVIYIVGYAINADGVGYGNEVILNTDGNKTYNGSIELTTQEEVIEFGSNNYNSITGSLRIGGSVSDLSPLNQLYETGLQVDIVESNLTNFQGLENLRVIADWVAQGFKIENNSLLESFDGLDNLNLIRGNFYIINNQNLQNFYGLNSLEYVSAGDMYITNNNNLVNLNGLNSLLAIGLDRFLAIQTNNSLIDISGLENLQTIKAISIDTNNSLTNLNGLQSVNNLESLSLNQNASLSDINAVANTETLRGLIITGNNNLIDLPVFENLTSFSTLKINFGSPITSLSAFQNVNNMDLLELFQSNFTSLEGLDSLTHIGILSLNQNENLISLNGLESLTSADNIGIYDNPNLSNFCSLTNLFTNGFVENYGVEFNAQNPTGEDIINGNCN